jgi:hypothetical protein
MYGRRSKKKIKIVPFILRAVGIERRYQVLMSGDAAGYCFIAA